MVETSQAWIAAAPERERADICGIAQHRFGSPDCGAFAGHLLGYASHNAMFRPQKWQSHVIGDGHRKILLIWSLQPHQGEKLGYAVEYYAIAFPAKKTPRCRCICGADWPSNERDGSMPLKKGS
jgi:hypothetical protein